MFDEGTVTFDVIFVGPETNKTQNVVEGNKTNIGELIPGSPYNVTVLAYDQDGVIVGKSEPQTFQTGITCNKSRMS